MKANKILFATVLSLISFQAMSPNELLTSNKSSIDRMPASAAAAAASSESTSIQNQNSEIKIINNIIVANTDDTKYVTAEEMKVLRNKLAFLEKSVKSKEVLLAENSQKIKKLQDLQAEEKIQELTKTIAEQKSEITTLKTAIQNAEIKNAENQKKHSQTIDAAICKSELKGEKLEADVKKLLEDQEAVLKEVQGLKKENEDLKAKLVTAPEVKSEAKKSENSELVALMSQFTTMFTAQMQSQMQMQVQMMSMLSQMQNNSMPEISPYAFNPSQFSNIQNFGYPQAGQFGGYGVGISAASPWSNYENPYSLMPQLNRNQLIAPQDYGFSFRQPMQGFDFNQAPAAEQQRLPAGQRLQLPFSSQIISV